MVRPRHSASFRALALALLLWGGFDLGAHGLLGPDFAPIPAGASAARVDAGGHGGSTPAGHDHCFCNGIYEGAAAPSVAEALAPAGGVPSADSSQAPRADGHPLDRPPQLIA